MTDQRILSTVSRDDFVGRDAELRQIARLASPLTTKRGVELSATPDVGASEFLRQVYDQVFYLRGESIPVLFAFKRGENLTDAARRFFQTSVQQYVAYRRVEPALCNASLTLGDLVQLALPGDFELVSELVEAFDRERNGGDQEDFVRFCFNVAHRLSKSGRDVFQLIDCIQLSWILKEESTLGTQIAKALSSPGKPFALVGLRRRLRDLIQTGNNGHELGETVQLGQLSDDDARRLIQTAAARYGVDTNEPTRDLLVQQLNGSPVFMGNLLQVARDRQTPLNSFLNCQRLYVDELMGGYIGRHFSRIIDEAAPNPQTRKMLLRILYESASAETQRPSLWAWKKRLGADTAEYERIVGLLHVHELANSSGSFIEVNREAVVWMDYLRARYRIEVAGEARALVVATTLLDTLKRAPQTMARKYRRAAALGLRDLFTRFDCQQLPASLFHYDRFAAAHKGADPVAIDAALDTESDVIRLPQIVHATDCAAFGPSVGCDPERCSVGHGFEAADYSDESEIVWLAVEIDSKLEASRELTQEWLNRLLQISRECGFQRVRLWLMAPEGFSEEACALLAKREAYYSSRRQVELITERLARPRSQPQEMAADEYELVIPMGDDTELIAANTVEQIARRLKFRPDAINQIKTAVVEACINAAEHSLSPDRKIYQRFRVDDDKLVVTVASRGVVPESLASQNGGVGKTSEEMADAKSRRGWGLKLIKTLMDEVEFERVDDGTQLRMTKYRR
jgi:serine/threonine-protein kinase RsbW